jgi:hypothetical protein
MRKIRDRDLHRPALQVRMPEPALEGYHAVDRTSFRLFDGLCLLGVGNRFEERRAGQGA